MRGFVKLSPIAGLAIFAAAGSPAWAQQYRGWVSSSGVDGNPCTQSQPCLTFQRAHDVVSAGGEVNCLSAGSFGPLIINKSITVDCSGVFGAGLAAGSSGIIINTAGVNVVIRGLSLSGGLAASNAQSGISFSNGESLTVDNAIIQNFGLSTGGDGIRFVPNTASRLHVINTLITNNGRQSDGVGDGIRIDPTGAGYANVTLEDVRLIGNAGDGLRVDVTGNTGSSTNVVANRSAFTSSRNGVQVIAPTGTAGARVTLLRSIATNNILNGLFANLQLAQINVSNSAIAGNSNGLGRNAGTILSYGNNELIGNGTNGTFSGVIAQN